MIENSGELFVQYVMKGIKNIDDHSSSLGTCTAYSSYLCTLTNKVRHLLQNEKRGSRESIAATEHSDRSLVYFQRLSYFYMNNLGTLCSTIQYDTATFDSNFISRNSNTYCEYILYVRTETKCLKHIINILYLRY